LDIKTIAFVRGGATSAEAERAAKSAVAASKTAARYEQGCTDALLLLLHYHATARKSTAIRNFVTLTTEKT
jgi:hypothetical protein